MAPLWQDWHDSALSQADTRQMLAQILACMFYMAAIAEQTFLFHPSSIQIYTWMILSWGSQNQNWEHFMESCQFLEIIYILNFTSVTI